MELKFELKSNFSTCPDVGGWAVRLNDNNAILNSVEVVVEVEVELGNYLAFTLHYEDIIRHCTDRKLHLRANFEFKMSKTNGKSR